MADKLKPGDLLILGNTNNPTGLRIPEKALMQVYDAVTQKMLFCFWMRHSLSFVLLITTSICVIRAATKFFGLPGIRLGYGFTSSQFAEKYRDIESPWSVNLYANAAGRCIFRDNDYIEKTKMYIKREREYLITGLSEIGWLKPYRSDANFILLKLQEFDEDIVFDRLINNGIMVRKASNFEGLDRNFIKIAVKDHESNEKLIRLFGEFILKLFKRKYDIREALEEFIRIEPTDSIIFREMVQLDYKKDRYYERIGDYTKFYILAFEGSRMVDTIAYNKRNLPPLSNLSDILQLAEDRIKSADISKIAAASTISINRSLNRLSYGVYSAAFNLKNITGGLGIIGGHSGDVLGKVYDDRERFLHNAKYRYVIPGYKSHMLETLRRDEYEGDYDCGTNEREQEDDGDDRYNKGLIEYEV